MDDLVLCGELEEGQWCVINADKSKVIVLNGEEGLECEVHLDRIQLEHVSEIIYLGYGVGGVWVQLLGVRWPAFMLFLFYMNVS